MTHGSLSIDRCHRSDRSHSSSVFGSFEFPRSLRRHIQQSENKTNGSSRRSNHPSCGCGKMKLLKHLRGQLPQEDSSIAQRLCIFRLYGLIHAIESFAIPAILSRDTSCKRTVTMNFPWTICICRSCWKRWPTNRRRRRSPLSSFSIISNNLHIQNWTPFSTTCSMRCTWKRRAMLF